MIENKKVLAVVPARGGSKGIPNKNIAPLHGKPLINWTIEAAQASQYIDRLILSSDDARICRVAESAGCEVPFVRRKELATDDAKSIDVVLDSLEKVPGFDLIVLLQPTSPLRSTSDIDGCLELLVDQSAHSAVTVAPAQEHPYLIYSMDAGGRLDPFIGAAQQASLRRQDLPGAYSLNGAVYVAEIEWLRKTRSFISGQPAGYVMPKLRSVDIDDQEDLELAAEYLSAMSI